MSNYKKEYIKHKQYGSPLSETRRVSTGLLPTPKNTIFASLRPPLLQLKQTEEKGVSTQWTNSRASRDITSKISTINLGLQKPCEVKSERSFRDKTSLLDLSFSDDVIYSLRAAKKFEDYSLITSISFSLNGEFLASSSKNDIINLYNMNTGTVHKTIPSKKYGVDLVNFLQENNSIIHASTKIDDTIRYLNVETNQYIRYFPGHSKRVTQLKIDHTGGLFLSAGKDQKLLLWDVRSPNAQGQLNMNGVPVADFDPEGLLFAVSLNSKSVKLYDLRSYDKGPFSSLNLKDDVFIGQYINGLKFAPHGLHIMLHSNERSVHIIDAFDGATVKILDDLNNNGLPIDVTYSPDGSYIFAGSWNGNVHIWQAATGRKICILKNVHATDVPTFCVQHNPKYMTFVSASDSTVFWIPMVNNYNYSPLESMDQF